VLHVPVALLTKGPAYLLEKGLVDLMSWSGQLANDKILDTNTDSADRSHCVIIMNWEHGQRKRACWNVKRLLASLYITGLNIQKSYVQPTQCIYVFCVDLRTAIISLCSINWMVCITEECLLRGTDWTFNIHKFYVLPTQCIYVYIFGPVSIPGVSVWDMW
jgi:hypothetical protein